MLVRVSADGPACHDGTTSCFTPWLWRKILRRETGRPAGSYVVELLKGGVGTGARKVGEEAIELVVAALTEMTSE